MDIGIIGAGSIGLLLAAYLAKDHQVTCYVRREEQKHQIRRNGVVLHNSRHNPHKTFRVNAEKLEALGRHDFYMVCVKYPQLADVLQMLEEKADTQKPVLFIQNGMAHVDLISRMKRTVFVAVLDHGAKRRNDYTVIHTGKGSVQTGVIDRRGETLLQNKLKALHTVEFPWFYHDDPVKLLRRKLVVNAVINPLTALFDVQNGEILTNPYLYHLAKGLCEETCQVLELEFDQNWEYVQNVADRTKLNSSSMREDIRRGNPSEIETISGYIMNQDWGSQYTYTSFVYNGIMAKERSGRETFD
ncbi:2-dehydropantoate 2-reductase [Virgibacillus sp. MSP4-1]|uniref:2-dehydropantoate 2-reductase n=1 Tax=Virgibacillus sp. MSP4-1 TaxID=2700081 RepID=UPI0003A10727|nr:2-dehydropantoate 2-reductase [Virgibacillus sp. MSP4-1]QHS22155.1 2-dehydropantoate 2-reductase [Virgibacillus sp. MSP4-1]